MTGPPSEPRTLRDGIEPGVIPRKESLGGHLPAFRDGRDIEAVGQTLRRRLHEDRSLGVGAVDQVLDGHSIASFICMEIVPGRAVADRLHKVVPCGNFSGAVQTAAMMVSFDPHPAQ